MSVWKSGLARSIGVSNFNSTNMQDLKDAGLPLPASNQIQFHPGIVTPGNPFFPYAYTETFEALLAWCKANNVLVNGWGPFGGSGQAGKTFSNPSIQSIAAAHNVSAAQAVLRWNVQQGIPVIPMATNPAYQAENMNIFGFNLTANEMKCMGTLLPADCPPPPPPPPLPSCSYTLGSGTQLYQINLTTLPPLQQHLHDRFGNPYSVVSPCKYTDGTTSPAVEEVLGGLALGYASNLAVEALPAAIDHGAGGLRLVLGGGSTTDCGAGRTVWYASLPPPPHPPLGCSVYCIVVPSLHRIAAVSKRLEVRCDAEVTRLNARTLKICVCASSCASACAKVCLYASSSYGSASASAKICLCVCVCLVRVLFG